MLPKVFMKNEQKTIFGISKDEILTLDSETNFKHDKEFEWIRQISVYFYNSLIEFRKRNKFSSLIQTSLSKSLNSNLGQQEYSYLDLLLSFVNFYKKNKSIILFKHIQSTSQNIKNTNWQKTIRKSVSILNQNGQPVYSKFSAKNKKVDSEEELLTYFVSILYHFNKEHLLHLKIDKSYKIIKGIQFETLQKNGLSKLKKIKYKYFNDTLKKIYYLCEAYFHQTSLNNAKENREEFISINNYNLVFEDMVDKLFSDKIEDIVNEEGLSLKNLKYNEDGKIIDHVYDYQSLIDTSNIFYIGDSKYYKSNNIARNTSKYKQITYSKNVIQYNIDLLNKQQSYKENIRYRDELTEGYNITPNFFIYGYIDDYRNFEGAKLEERGKIINSFHFENRLFDRDTLFVHQYQINFLYVLKNYSQFSRRKIEEFRRNTKKRFRNNFIRFFNDNQKSKFTFYEYEESDISDFVETNFRKLNGKCFKTSDNRLIIAKHNEDRQLEDVVSKLKIYLLV